MTTQPTAIDLFAGAGLFSYAFAEEGFRLIQAVELNEVACRTYQTNLGNHIVNGEVEKVRPAGYCDVLIAGPPCQGFSTLGKRRHDDPRNMLSLQVVRWTQLTNPRIVVIENVAAFLDAPVWDVLRGRLTAQGYTVEPFVLNAYDFGVPQLRSRSFTIATRGDLPDIRRPRGPRVRTVREAWRGLPSEPDGMNGHVAPEPSKIALSRMQHIPRGGDRRDVLRRAPHLAPPSWHFLGCQVSDVWGRMSWEAPSNTLRTAFLNASKGRYIHPSQNRVISLREGCRLHSIPDTWEFCGTPYQVARQIGNSVPPRLGRAVARAVRRTISS